MVKKEQLERVSAFTNAIANFDPNVRIEDIRDRDMVIREVIFFPTGWGEGMGVRADLDGKEIRFVTWSQVLMDQARLFEDHLPLIGKIVKVKNYYTFA